MADDLSSRVRAAIEAERDKFTVPLSVLRDDLTGQIAARLARWVQPPERARQMVAQMMDAILPPDSTHITVDHDTVRRRCEADLRTLDRHRCKLEFEILVVNGVEQRTCEHCGHSWPCEDFRDRASAYGVPVDPEGS